MERLVASFAAPLPSLSSITVTEEEELATRVRRRTNELAFAIESHRLVELTEQFTLKAEEEVYHNFPS